MFPRSGYKSRRGSLEVSRRDSNLRRNTLVVEIAVGAADFKWILADIDGDVAVG